MTPCFLILKGQDLVSQTGRETSFIGGKPKLPSECDIPVCSLCEAKQSFFFQIAFPEDNPWAGVSLAVFSCTSCADRANLIPAMLDGPLAGADIPGGFLDTYQTNFRFLTFETGAAKLRSDYREKIKFSPISLEFSSNPSIDETKIGGTPNWILEDESPRSYGGKTPMFFLMQVLSGFEFELLKGAPRQIELGLDCTPRPSLEDYYQLFIGTNIYFFGTCDRSNRSVYAISQVD